MLSLDELSTAIADSDAQWVAGETEIAAMVSELGDGNIFGLALTDEQQDQLFGAAAADEASSGLFAAAAAPPPSVDWRIGGWVTPVRRQGTCQACVAFALCASFESRARISTSNAALELDLSEADLFFGAGRHCAVGWAFDPALIRSRDVGVGAEADFPFTGVDAPATPIAPVIHAVGWASGTTMDARKAALFERGPIIAGMETYQDLSYYKGGIYQHVAGSSTGKHAVCVVGYDDSGGFWIVKNSWGPAWGEAGFLRIKYGDCGLDTAFPFYDPTVGP